MSSLLALQFCCPGESTPLTPHYYAPGIMHTSLRIVATLSNIKFMLLIRIFKNCDCVSCKRKRLAQTRPTTRFPTCDRTQSRIALSAEVLPNICSLVRSLHSSHKIHQLLVTMFVFGATAPQWARASSFTRFLDHTHNDAPQSVGLLWTSDQHVEEAST
jgi:hypothetical protein